MNKIKYIFAESTPKATYNTQVEGSYFYGYTFDAVICKDKEVINPQWATAFACFSLSLARRGGVTSLLLYYTYLIFSHMPKTRKNASSAQGACTSTSAHETSKSTIIITNSAYQERIDLFTQALECLNKAHVLLNKQSPSAKEINEIPGFFEAWDASASSCSESICHLSSAIGELVRDDLVNEYLNYQKE